VNARFSLRRNNQPAAPPSPAEERAEAYTAAGYDTTPSLEFDNSGENGVGYEGDPTVHEPGTVYDPADPAVYEPIEPAAYGPNEEDDESWLAPDTRRRVRLAVPTFALGALVVIAGAFWGGAEVDKHFGSSNNTTTASAIAAALRGRGAGAEGAGAGTGREGFAGFAGLGGAGGGGGFAGGGFAGTTPAASGTVSAISGDDLTVNSTSGGKVKVVLNSSTIVSRTGKGSTGPVQVGDTVRVQGTKASNGTVTATSVTAVAPGVTTGAGGGGFAGVGAGAGGSETLGSGASSGGSTSGGSTTATTVHNGGFSGDGTGVSG
jgi:hypothetical protein